MLHVTDVLQTTPDENLNMIQDSLAYLKAQGKEVIYDAEHFFDGAKLDMEYGFDTLAAAAAGGADVIVLCDTNGGSMPWEVAEFVYKARELFPRRPSAFTRTMTAKWLSRIRSRRCERARPMSRARSMVMANAAATPISAASFPISSSSWACPAWRKTGIWRR